MILVDTSVWVDHLRSGDAQLMAFLDHGEVMTHAFVLGELACGNLRQRTEVLTLLRRLPQATEIRDEEALLFIERHALMGRGIGYVDVHLLAATAMDGRAKLWTRDRHLRLIADELGLALE